ncbi:MAG: response regulator transcription factor [Bacteroidota bacterium]
MKILIVEDQKKLLDSILNYFKRENYVCDISVDYGDASEKIYLNEYDCVIVDIMLPDGSGLDLIKELKEKDKKTGIIIISAKDALDDKIKGLELGSDDYLTKPFHLSELNARVKAVIRRKCFEGSNIIKHNEIKIDLNSHSVYVNDEPVVLTPKEYELLIYLITNKNRVVKKSSISERLWGDYMDMASSYDFIYAQIKNLRKKLVDKGCGNYLKNIYGIGYKFIT